MAEQGKKIKKELYGLFHLIAGSPNIGNAEEPANGKTVMPHEYNNIDKEHILSGAYTDKSGNTRDDPMVKITGLDLEEEPEKELHLGM